MQERILNGVNAILNEFINNYPEIQVAVQSLP